MTTQATLTGYLDTWLGENPARQDLHDVIQRLVECGSRLAVAIASGVADGQFAPETGVNADGDTQKGLDVYANQLYLDSLRNSPVREFASEELDETMVLASGGSLDVAIDPLDGSSNIETNLTVGTIFGIFPARDGGISSRRGEELLAAGFFVYGPQTQLVLTLGDGTHIFRFDRHTETYQRVDADVSIAVGRLEFAINSSNYRFWDESIRSYIDDCVAGESGPRGADFNMRWTASLVAEALRILRRGGIFIYPGDSRPGYRSGRLRLLYEAFPIAMIIEQAGGAASDGLERILDRTPDQLHQRVPLVFGARDKVERVSRYYLNPPNHSRRHPLFRARQLFTNQ